MEAWDSFSRASDDYARDRPRYPDPLFSWIAGHCRHHHAAWDCATGNGQAAAALAKHFEWVEATDISPGQIAQGFRAPNIGYSTRPAERTGFGDAHFDLIAVAQALHWFDLGPFWREVWRVAKPGALFCAWGYSWIEGNESLQEHFFEPMLALLGPYWAPNNRLLWNGYRSDDIAFPFERLDAPPISIKVDWDIAAIVRFVRTWSSHKRAVEDCDVARAIARLENEAQRRFGQRGAMPLAMPLAVAAGRVG